MNMFYVIVFLFQIMHHLEMQMILNLLGILHLNYFHQENEFFQLKVLRMIELLRRVLGDYGGVCGWDIFCFLVLHAVGGGYFTYIVHLHPLSQLQVSKRKRNLQHASILA